MYDGSLTSQEGDNHYRIMLRFFKLNTPEILSKM